MVLKNQTILPAPFLDIDALVPDISTYDDATSFLVAQNAATNTYNPGLWSRFDWTWHEGRYWYCQSAYDAASEADALATPAADPADPPAGGCGGWPWSGLDPVDR